MAVTILLAIAAAMSTPAAPDSAEMTRVADTFDRAQIVQDKAALERLVDDELVFITGSGERTDKRAFIDGWLGENDRYNPITLVDRTLLPLGHDAFVVSAETTLSGTSEGKPFSSRFRFSDTFRRRDGTWKAVHIQVTRIGN